MRSRSCCCHLAGRGWRADSIPWNQHLHRRDGLLTLTQLRRLQALPIASGAAPVHCGHVCQRTHAALALAVGLLAAEAEAILAAFFAIWSAAIVVVNLRGRIDPAGGFAAALGAPQREDLERLQSAGLLLLPEDDPGPWKLHVLQGLAWAIGFAGVVTLVADVAG